MEIALGMPILVLSMMVIMGVPFFHYLKRDKAYRATEGQPEKSRIAAWYA